MNSKALLLEKITLSNNYLSSVLKRLIGGDRVIDLLLFPPLSYNQIENAQNKELQDISAASLMQVLEVIVIEHIPSFKISVRKPYKIIALTNTKEEIQLTFFGGNAVFWKNTFKKGMCYKIYGKVIRMGSNFSISHPKIISDSFFKTSEEISLKAHYSITPPFTQNRIHSLLKRYLDYIKNFNNDWLVNDEFLSFREAVRLLHLPLSQKDIEEAKRRLALDELLSRNLALLLARHKAEKVKSPFFYTKEKLIGNTLEVLPFKLTEGQLSALSAILSIQKKTVQSNILLQGDVGSGKTIVALLSALNAVEAGYQVAIMAPTYILAYQTFSTFSFIIKDIPMLFFSGDDKGKVRREKLEIISTDKAKIIIGTHALFSPDVKFKTLGFVIIDEQHRFGIKQRLELTMKAKGVKTLLMTATPIPRTLSMALYGDIEVCYIKTKPQNRKEIITKIFSISRVGEILEAIKRKIAGEERVYWVVPVIDEKDSQESHSASLGKRYSILKDIFGKEKISIVHGRMKDSEIEIEMRKFQKGETSIMLATTVIEVGVDVPMATVMIIESAENFGLATLHQLRGRVGRSCLQSYCFLIFQGKKASEKLNIIANITDGFIVAEKDMEMRGSGAMLRNMQSGFEAFKFVNILEDGEIFKKAKVLANQYIKKYGFHLNDELKVLLEFFDYSSYLEYFQN